MVRSSSVRRNPRERWEGSCGVPVEKWKDRMQTYEVIDVTEIGLGVQPRRWRCAGCRETTQAEANTHIHSYSFGSGPSHVTPSKLVQMAAKRTQHCTVNVPMEKRYLCCRREDVAPSCESSRNEGAERLKQTRACRHSLRCGPCRRALRDQERACKFNISCRNVEFQLSGTGMRAAEVVENSERRELETEKVCVLDDNHDKWLDEPVRWLKVTLVL